MNNYAKILKQHGISLNKAQLAAASEFFGPVLINSLAGTGKTSTIVGRIILQHELMPEGNIVALSFSKKSCEELSQRLNGVYNTHVSTIHSFLYNRVLRASGYYNNFTFIPNEAARRSLIKKALFESHTEDKLLVKDVIDALNSGVADTEEKLAALNAYLDLLKDSKLLDCDAILFFSKEVLEVNPAVGYHIRSSIMAIVIDEMQDTSSLMCDCLKLLFPVESAPNICMVLDFHQSIYKFRGASPEAVKALCCDYYEAKQMNLTMNYRSSQAIIDIVNQVMPPCGTKLVAANKEPSSQPMFYAAATAKDEAALVINKMKEFHDQKGYKYEDMAILFRASAVTDVLYEEMLKAKIPFTRVGSSALKYNNSRFKACYALLTLLYTNKPSLVLGCALPILGAASSLVEYVKSSTEAKSGRKISEILDSIPSLSKNQKARFKAFFSIDTKTAKLEDVVRQLYNDFLKGYYRVKDDSVLEELLEIIGSDSTYEMLSKHIAEVRRQEKAMKALVYNNTDHSVLMSIHASKGLQWPIVFLVGASASIMPLCKADTNVDEAEERRLAYVACSRSKQELIVSYNMVDSKGYSHSPSPYFAKFFKNK